MNVLSTAVEVSGHPDLTRSTETSILTFINNFDHNLDEAKTLAKESCTPAGRLINAHNGSTPGLALSPSKRMGYRAEQVYRVRAKAWTR
ncbi:hypothetical protein JCM3765_005385 [Sporobolomyces pararoseus]